MIFFDLDIEAICKKYSLTDSFDEIPKHEIEPTKEALLAVVSLKNVLHK